MLIHATFPLSAVNGPGNRAVVWLQGCTLGCTGCWNPHTHAFTAGEEKTIEELGDWLLSLPGIEGVTFSGGEPLQQASELLELCAYLKVRRPDISIGLFSGYTLQELESGRWKFRSGKSGEWAAGTPALFSSIRRFLDFGVFGRYNSSLASSDKPLCGSRNQNVVFFTERYSELDLEGQSYEVNISDDGQLVTITGFPSA